MILDSAAAARPRAHQSKVVTIPAFGDAPKQTFIPRPTAQCRLDRLFPPTTTAPDGPSHREGNRLLDSRDVIHPRSISSRDLLLRLTALAFSCAILACPATHAPVSTDLATGSIQPAPLDRSFDDFAAAQETIATIRADPAFDTTATGRGALYWAQMLLRTVEDDLIRIRISRCSESSTIEQGGADNPDQRILLAHPGGRPIDLP